MGILWKGTVSTECTFPMSFQSNCVFPLISTPGNWVKWRCLCSGWILGMSWFSEIRSLIQCTLQIKIRIRLFLPFLRTKAEKNGVEKSPRKVFKNQFSLHKKLDDPFKMWQKLLHCNVVNRCMNPINWRVFRLEQEEETFDNRGMKLHSKHPFIILH